MSIGRFPIDIRTPIGIRTMSIGHSFFISSSMSIDLGKRQSLLQWTIGSGDMPVESTGFWYCTLDFAIATERPHKFTAPVPVATGALVALFFHCRLLAVDSCTLSNLTR
jgi:hypothetical protein